MKNLFLILLIFAAFSLHAAPLRIISLSPAVTQTIIYSGGTPFLCGRSSCCDSLTHLPVAGDLGRPFVESVLSLKPDLVISDSRYPGNEWQTLEKLNIKTLFLKTEKLDDLQANLLLLSKLPGLEASALSAAENMEQKLTHLRKTVPGKRIAALIVFGVDPIISCGKKSFIDEAMTLAGLDNICAGYASGKTAGYFVLNPEFICQQDPEVIILCGGTESENRDAGKFFHENKVFQKITAVKNRRIITLDPAKFCRLTPFLIEEISRLRSRLTGDLLK